MCELNRRLRDVNLLAVEIWHQVIDKIIQVPFDRKGERVAAAWGCPGAGQGQGVGALELKVTVLPKEISDRAPGRPFWLQDT